MATQASPIGAYIYSEQYQERLFTIIILWFIQIVSGIQVYNISAKTWSIWLTKVVDPIISLNTSPLSSPLSISSVYSNICDRHSPPKRMEIVIWKSCVNGPDVLTPHCGNQVIVQREGGGNMPVPFWNGPDVQIHYRGAQEQVHCRSWLFSCA